MNATIGKSVNWSTHGLSFSRNLNAAASSEKLYCRKVRGGYGLRTARKNVLTIGLSSGTFKVDDFNMVVIDGVEFVRKKKGRK